MSAEFRLFLDTHKATEVVVASAITAATKLPLEAVKVLFLPVSHPTEQRESRTGASSSSQLKTSFNVTLVHQDAKQGLKRFVALFEDPQSILYSSPQLRALMGGAELEVVSVTKPTKRSSKSPKAGFGGQGLDGAVSASRVAASVSENVKARLMSKGSMYSGPLDFDDPFPSFNRSPTSEALDESPTSVSHIISPSNPLPPPQALPTTPRLIQTSSLLFKDRPKRMSSLMMEASLAQTEILKHRPSLCAFQLDHCTIPQTRKKKLSKDMTAPVVIDEDIQIGKMGKRGYMDKSLHITGASTVMIITPLNEDKQDHFTQTNETNGSMHHPPAVIQATNSKPKISITKGDIVRIDEALKHTKPVNQSVQIDLEPLTESWNQPTVTNEQEISDDVVSVADSSDPSVIEFPEDNNPFSTNTTSRSIIRTSLNPSISLMTSSITHNSSNPFSYSLNPRSSSSSALQRPSSSSSTSSIIRQQQAQLSLRQSLLARDRSYRDSLNPGIFGQLVNYIDNYDEQDDQSESSVDSTSVIEERGGVVDDRLGSSGDLVSGSQVRKSLYQQEEESFEALRRSSLLNIQQFRDPLRVTSSRESTDQSITPPDTTSTELSMRGPSLRSSVRPSIRQSISNSIGSSLIGSSARSSVVRPSMRPSIASSSLRQSVDPSFREQESELPIGASVVGPLRPSLRESIKRSSSSSRKSQSSSWGWLWGDSATDEFSDD